MCPRPCKPRTCECPFRKKRAFKPTGVPMAELPQVVLGADELEALRLCDLERLMQEEAGERMGISRGTVQRILYRARSKVVRALIEGHALVLEPESKESPT